MAELTLGVGAVLLLGMANAPGKHEVTQGMLTLYQAQPDTAAFAATPTMSPATDRRTGRPGKLFRAPEREREGRSPEEGRRR